MDRRERIQAAVRGEPVDRVPVALWRHFPHADSTAEGLAQSVVDFQKTFDFDLIKVTPAAGYVAEAYGADLFYLDNDEGTRGYNSRPVNSHADWLTLMALDPYQGVLARELEALRLIRAGVGSDVPILETIFSPLSSTKNLAGPLWLADLRDHPADFHAGLKAIAETTARFARAALESGADGIFFASQLANREFLTEEEYRKCGLPYDQVVLDAIRPRADLVLLHVHGMDIYFDLMVDYPAQIINWHDRRTPPSLAAGKERFKGAVLGGIDEWAVLLRGTPDEVTAQVRDAIRQTGGRQFIAGAGCVTAVTTPEANIRAAREAVERESA
jgi:uroporphyrinogen decarboxylase